MQKINLAVGEKKVIQLPDLATAGYNWEIGGKFENIISVEKLKAEKEANSKNVGGTKDISFEITGLKKGVADLNFYQKRSWEKQADAVKEKLYEVTVE